MTWTCRAPWSPAKLRSPSTWFQPNMFDTMSRRVWPVADDSNLIRSTPKHSTKKLVVWGDHVFGRACDKMHTANCSQTSWILFNPFAGLNLDAETRQEQHEGITKRKVCAGIMPPSGQGPVLQVDVNRKNVTVLASRQCEDDLLGAVDFRHFWHRWATQEGLHGKSH